METVPMSTIFIGRDAETKELTLDSRVRVTSTA